MSLSKAAILSCGNELLLGQVVDTNATHLSKQLTEMGWYVSEIRAVRDDQEQLSLAITQLAQDHQLLILTGGLGPTEDDLTRQALADAAGVRLSESAELLAMIQNRFNEIARPMSPNNRRQALLPDRAKGLPNSFGTAPGLHLTIGSCQIFALPGVPQEMRHMFADTVAPLLPSPGGMLTKSLELHTYGIGESRLSECLKDLMLRGRNPEVGTCVDDYLITVRITASGPDVGSLDSLLARDAQEVRQRLSDHIFSEGEISLPQAVLTILQEKEQTLSLAESCTGGWVSKLLTDIPGSSSVFLEGHVTYTNTAKQKYLSVSQSTLERFGAVSEEVACEMAQGVCKASGSDFGIGITGVAGPDGGTPEKPVGLVHIAICGPRGIRHQACRFAMPRNENRLRAVHVALGMLWQMIASD